MAAVEFSDAELRAYLEEQLPVARSAELESALRNTPTLARRLQLLLTAADDVGFCVEAVWRKRRLSCPARGTWERYLTGDLGHGLMQYLEFHLNTMGCRVCAANVDDLRRGRDAAAQQRTRRVFESSIGHLHALPRPMSSAPSQSAQSAE